MPVSLRRIATTDPAASVTALLAGWLWVLVLAIYVHHRVTGFQPRESWTEVLAVVAVLTAGAWALCRHRARSVREVLDHGTRVPAQVERVLTYPPFTRVRLAFPWQGSSHRRDFLLAAGRRPRALEGRSQVTLALLPAEPGRAVIADLYE